MIDTLITIATNNDSESLTRLIMSMKDTLGENDYVLVVCTDNKPKFALKLLEKQGIKGTATGIDGGYDTGAYVFAYQTHSEAKYYIFMQDSLEIIDLEWIKNFREKLTGMIFNRSGVVAYTQFHFFFDEDPHQQEWVEEQYGHDFPYYGIFGPIFLATGYAMGKIKLPKAPTNKLEQQAGERTWAMAFHNAGIEVVAINEEFWPQEMFEGKAKLLKKFFKHRK